MDSRLHGNDEAQASTPHYLVIPAKSLPLRRQGRESISRTPKGKLKNLGLSGVDASFRWHDEYRDSGFRQNDEPSRHGGLDPPSQNFPCIKNESCSGRFYGLKGQKHLENQGSS